MLNRFSQDVAMSCNFSPALIRKLGQLGGTMSKKDVAAALVVILQKGILRHRFLWQDICWSGEGSTGISGLR